MLTMLGLELLSLASYSLAGFHKGSKRSAEAALKYVVFGGLSAGVMLYGISLLFGLEMESLTVRVGYMNRYLPNAWGGDGLLEHAAILWFSQSIDLAEQRFG